MTKLERLLTTHREAEMAYRRLLKAAEDRGQSSNRLAAANARAEGLAEAVAILEGVDVVDVRARIRRELDELEADGFLGVRSARAALKAAGVTVEEGARNLRRNVGAMTL